MTIGSLTLFDITIYELFSIHNAKTESYVSHPFGSPIDSDGMNLY